ncbi:MAG TPA: nucleotide sugar dehydrogenase [Candidatus Paceibacterota bacterium]|nr:nucleotide sugar dehydrogenase [Candidatus Paceibacterota bacterium]
MTKNKICVIGMWHLGTVTAGCLAQTNNEIICFDFDKEVINNMKRGILPVFEPGLQELFDRARKKNNNISFSNNLKDIVPESDYIYITFDAPIDNRDRVNLATFNESVDKIIPLITPKTLIIISSQIPVGTCRKIIQKIRKKGKKNELCYIPENLRLGDAIKSFLTPERIIIGLSSELVKQKAENLFNHINARKIYMNLESAEMSKHAMNAYLATLISFSGEISNICEKVGANALDVINALKAEKRVSPYAPILPGLGFGGGTLARDIQILKETGSKNKVKTEVLNAVLSANVNRMKYVADRLKMLLGTLNNKKIAFFGLVYKAGTNTLRRSLTLAIIDQIKNKNVIISAYDPMIKNKIKNYDIEVCKSPIETVDKADALVIMTDWDEFKKIDYPALVKSMKNKIILDTKNILNISELEKNNVKYYGIGRSAEQFKTIKK